MTEYIIDFAASKYTMFIFFRFLVKLKKLVTIWIQVMRRLAIGCVWLHQQHIAKNKILSVIR